MGPTFKGQDLEHGTDKLSRTDGKKLPPLAT